MHPQLELLLEIQDLRTQRHGLSEGFLSDMETDVFAVSLDEAISALDEKVTELEARLDAPVRQRYRLVVDRGMRAVVPVLNGVCYGCFTAVPTARASVADRNARLETCEHCGRFLYHVD